MGLFRLIRFYEEASTFTEPDESALERAGGAGECHAGYHKRIVLLAGAFGVVGAVLGIVVSVMAASQGKPDESAKMILLAPLMFGAAGILFGVAVACLLAPRAFLVGPLGQKWMRLIGTESVLVARIVCLIFGLVVMAPFVGFGLLMAFAI